MNHEGRKEQILGVGLAVVLGGTAILIKHFTKNTLFDPLFVALVLGIILRSAVRFKEKTKKGLNSVAMLFIPVGAVFYGAVNLNFERISQVEIEYVFPIVVSFLVYIVSILLLSSWMKLKEKVTYLITAGSAICGASAIAITAGTIDAKPNEISKSLIAVFGAALVGFFLILPLTSKILQLTIIEKGVLSGAILQFTGFVKAAGAGLPERIQNIALSVKAARYLGLVFLMPLFSSFVRKKFHIPWFIIAFLLAGAAFSYMPAVAEVVRPTFKTILTILWSSAMGAIGLNAEIKDLFTKEGAKIFLVCLISFVLAMGIFILNIRMF